MCSPLEPSASQTRPLSSPALTIERDLAQCREELNVVRADKHCLNNFYEDVKTYAFITFDAQSRIVGWSRGAECILGYLAPEVLGQPGSILRTAEDRPRGEDENEFEIARRAGCAEEESWCFRKNGERFWASGMLTAHHDEKGKLQGYSKVMRDLTFRRLTEEGLREAEERLRLFSAHVTDYALVPVDPAGNVSGWNAGAERTFGYTQEAIIGQPVRLFFTPEDRANGESEKDLQRALAHGRAEDDRWMVRQDGSRFWSRWVTTPMRDRSGELCGFAKVLRDETERKQAEVLLRQSLQEKELLLREIHHRVKNNLQVVTSLLSLQASQLQDDFKMQRILDELQDRVRAIAALHEMLCNSRDLANIAFGPYLDHLIHELIAVNGIDAGRIEIRMKADDVALSLEQALPLGLIANELISNALKHAFPDKGPRRLSIDFGLSKSVVSEGPLDTSWYELVVQDNGCGIGDPDGIWQRESMGLRIIGLLTKQLCGKVLLDQQDGTRFSVCFPLSEVAADGKCSLRAS